MSSRILPTKILSRMLFVGVTLIIWQICTILFTSTDNHDVLILAYMNSGSSFVGKILGGRNDTFYWYEPLWATHKWRYLSENGEICDFRRDTCIPALQSGPKSLEKALDFLSDIYRCNDLSQYYGRFVEELMGNPNNTGHTGNTFMNCMKRCSREITNYTGYSYHSLNCSSLVGSSTYTCFGVMARECGSAKHRVSKVLRMDASHAQYLLDRHQRLKLIQIFRDPRAIINSRIHTHWFYKNLYYNFSTIVDIRTLCRRIDKDFTTAIRLSSLYPKRVKLIQYEDFSSPERLARALYTFAGMDPKQDIDRLLESATDDLRGFHPDDYRSSLQWDLVKEINDHCLNQIKQLGLRIFESETELRNRTLDLVIDKLPFSID